jgi:glycosyltransferase involved in cell wall biosynthesis
MTGDLVSVMMPAYNAEQYIGLAIESVLAQRYPGWELIIVDDGSTDRTAEIAASYQDPRIRILRQANQGESAARNAALESSKGVFVAFLDADDLFQLDHLEATVNFLRSHPEFEAVYTDGYHINGEGKQLSPLSARRRGPFAGWIYEEVVRASDVIGPPGCILMRFQPILDESLRFDPAIIIGPDWDFVLRYAENHPFGYIQDRTYLYRVHQSNITKTTAGSKRAISLATCRTKAIKTQKFGSCSAEVRYRVFYDLLINHLSGMPDRQAAAIGWQEFQALPQEMQAKLLRLMASKAILTGGDEVQIKSWLGSSLKLNRSDWRALLLQAAYPVSPAFCRKFLNSKGSFAEEEAPLSALDG